MEKKKQVENNKNKSTKLFNFIEIIKKHIHYLSNIIKIISYFSIILLISLIIYSIFIYLYYYYNCYINIYINDIFCFCYYSTYTNDSRKKILGICKSVFKNHNNDIIKYLLYIHFY